MEQTVKKNFLQTKSILNEYKGRRAASWADVRLGSGLPAPLDGLSLDNVIA